MKMKKILILVLSCLFLNGCEKGTTYTTSPRENFEALWKILDQNYCFFGYKEIDWNDIYYKYSPLIQDTMSRFELFDVLGDMLAELKDGHTNLYSSFDMARYWNWYEDYPPNYYKDIQDLYLGTDYKIAGGLKYKILSDANSERKIGYAYYGSFTNGISESNLDYMFLHFKECDGLIFDVRNNGGGALTYSERIASRFLSEKTLTGYTQYKNGNGHDDFTEPKAQHLSPSDRIRWLRPTVLLTNRHTYSAGNDFVSVMRILDQVTTLGDKTGGGCGLPFSSELPNGWGVRFSACPMYDANKELTEFGIEPDVKVLMDREEILSGKDALIDAAFQLLLKQSDSLNVETKSKISSEMFGY